MSVFSRELRIRDCDVSLNRRLRPSCLFSLLQEASIDHTEELGAGRSRTLDRGYLWVIVRQKVEIASLPEYDEHVRLESWPGETMHVFFPRYYRMLDTTGNVLLSASALWTLIDAQTRSFIFPERAGISVPGEMTGNEIALPGGIKSQPFTEKRIFSVPYSYTDLNGHMNNIRYLDLAEDCIPDTAAQRALLEIAVDFSREIRLGETIELSFGQSGNTWFFSGDAEKHCFSLLLRYDAP